MKNRTLYEQVESIKNELHLPYIKTKDETKLYYREFLSNSYLTKESRTEFAGSDPKKFFYVCMA